VALAAPAGPGDASMVAAQWTYDAYGKVVTADHISAHAFAHLGHKGLFVDRLDGAVTGEGMPGAGGGEAPRLGPFAETYAHVRHRVYFSALGRWGQADPNASGVSINAATPFFGRGFSPLIPRIDLGERYHDGPSLYQYLESNGWTASDPTGLMLLDTLITVGLGAAAMVAPGPGDFITGVLRALTAEYASRLDYDVDWATDWSQGDDWHSRLDNRWVTTTIGQGLHDAFDIGFGEYKVNPLDLFGSGAGRGRGGLPNPRLKIHGFKSLGKLSSLSPFDIVRAVKDCGFKVDSHFVDRLRGVGRKPDPARMESMGIRTMADIQQILRYGTPVMRNKQKFIQHGRAEVSLSSDGRTVLTIKHRRG